MQLTNAMYDIVDTPAGRTEDVDNIPRPVVFVRSTADAEDWEYAAHQHRKAQLLYCVRGVLNCEIENGVWIVPPQCAVWIPENLQHSTRGSGIAECCCIYIEPSAMPGLPRSCCTISVSGLLRELLMRAASFPQHYALGGAEERLMATLLDELAIAPVEGLHLPMPRDARLRRLAEMLLAAPGDKVSKSDWATRIGMSERSMSRVLAQEIGMGFSRWRQQLHVIIALRSLANGHSVQEVALDLGYENASGFITMFRKAVGKPPARYLAEQKAEAALAHIPKITLL